MKMYRRITWESKEEQLETMPINGGMIFGISQDVGRQVRISDYKGRNK